MANRLFPRLPHSHAEAIWGRICKERAKDLSGVPYEGLGPAWHAETGGTIVSDSELAEIRQSIIDLAGIHGFPESTGHQHWGTFDADCAIALYDLMDISHGEASRSEVWNFVTLQMLPSVAKWRFPKSDRERFFGGVRNTFQRLWARASTLGVEEGDDPGSIIRELSEDTLVQLMERPGVTSNPVLGRTIAEVGLQLLKKKKATVREEIFRKAIKAIRQRMVVVNLDAIANDDLEKIVKEHFRLAGARRGLW
jgi:hypothetical protein